MYRCRIIICGPSVCPSFLCILANIIQVARNPLRRKNTSTEYVAVSIMENHPSDIIYLTFVKLMIGPYSMKKNECPRITHPIDITRTPFKTFVRSSEFTVVGIQSALQLIFRLNDFKNLIVHDCLFFCWLFETNANYFTFFSSKYPKI